MTQLLLLAAMSCSFGATPLSQERDLLSPLFLCSRAPTQMTHQTMRQRLFLAVHVHRSGLSHLPSTDDQIMSNTPRSLRTQETPQGWCRTPRVPSGLAGPGGLQAGQLLWLASPRPTLSSRRQSPLMGGPGFRLRPHTTEKLLCSSLI